MSWIKVRKDRIELLVSEESYRDLFSKQGFEIVSEKPAPTQSLRVKEPKEIKEKESTKDELHVKPRSTKGSNSTKSTS